MSTLRLYAPAVVMMTWALAGALSVRGLGLQAAAVVSILVSVYMHLEELVRRKEIR